MALTKGLEALAVHIQEAQASMGHGEVRDRLSAGIRDAHADSGKWAHYIDHTGDGSSGDCIYEADGGMQSCPYSIEDRGGKSVTHVDTGKAQKVAPRVSYQPVADDTDQYTQMEAANLYTKGPVPLSERFISKAERDKADSGDFAGKGKSFPILKTDDVQAAVQSMGRAGSDNHSGNTLKKNIIAIAKKKGFGASLPKEWQGEEDLGMTPMEAQKIDITGDVIPLKEGAVGQDGTVLLKVIQPGWGSSGYYPADVLERDLPRIYPAGTKQFWDHATQAEEAARPEGSLRNLASVSLEAVKYLPAGPDGPGGYCKVRAAQEFRQPIDDLAKYIGVSIRASGKAKQGTAPDGRKGNIITSLEHGDSFDYVTTPGAGGKVLQLFEAARTRGAQQFQEGDSDMTETEKAELRSLREANQNAASELRKLKERGAKLDAAEVVSEYFTTIRVGEAVQAEVKKTLLERVLPLTATGDLDKAALTKLAEAETIRELEFIERATGHKIVKDLGSGSPTQLTEAQKEEVRKREAEDGNRFAELIGVSGKAGRRIMREGRSAFDINYNSGDRDGIVSGVGKEAA